MSKKPRAKRKADEIAEMAARGEDVSAYFRNKFTVVGPVRWVHVDLTQGMLRELDERAAWLNISRQAVIKTLLERALSEDRTGHRRKKKARKAHRGAHCESPATSRFQGLAGGVIHESVKK